MKKNKTKFYFITILLIHILVYFFKIDRDIFTFQEYYNRPNQTYTEQLLLKRASYFSSSISGFFQISKICDVKNNCPEIIAIWNAIFLSYNSQVHHLLKFNESCFAPAIRVFTVLCMLNIFNKSSDDEDPEYRFCA